MRDRNDPRALAVVERLAAQGADEPGVAVSVIRGGDVIVRRYAGLAGLEPRIPIGPATRFHIVSVSKTFVAAAVLVLASRGALRLDDDVRRYIPELPGPEPDGPAPAGAVPVTIRHLLSMTSGLRDVLEIERLRGVWTSAPSRTRELLDLAYRQPAASAPPGAQYMYANVNVLLLDELIARASGMPADAFRRAALYEPLGLAATMARPHDGLRTPDLAEPYVPDGRGGWSRSHDLLGIAADTLTTTLDDLTRWLLALRTGTVNAVAVTAAMADRTRLQDGTPIHYGLGLAVRRYRGLTVLCHTGSQPGYKAHVAYVPARDLGVVILSNREDTQPAALAASIMAELIGDDFPGPHPADAAGRRSRQMTAAERSAVEGSYVDVETGEWATLAVEDGVLRAETLGDPLVLYDEGGGVFRDGDDYRATVPAELRIEHGPRPGDVTCRLDLGGQRIALRRCDTPRYSAAALEAFTGRYESSEIASRHAIRVQDGALTVEYGPGADHARRFAMEPIAPDIFLVRPTAPGIAYRHVFRFERDPDGAVVSAVVTMERLKGVRLRRVPGYLPSSAASGA
jgi:CubicO group peptidase (beta-lactamase class C family)